MDCASQTVSGAAANACVCDLPDAMRRAIVIGCPGSGKTTFARRLATTGLPLYHLDAIWHKADGTHISREEFDARLGDVLALDAWIIDGNYGRTMERRMAACDTVFLFDLPREVCLAGAVARIGVARPDMPWIETELDPKFRMQIEAFAERELPEIYALIERYRIGRRIVVFKSREEADAFLSHVTDQS